MNKTIKHFRNYDLRLSYLDDLELIDFSIKNMPFLTQDDIKQVFSEINIQLLADYNHTWYFPPLMFSLLDKWNVSGISKKNLFFGHGSFNLIERIKYKLFYKVNMLGFGPQFNEIPGNVVASRGAYTNVLADNNFVFDENLLISKIISSKNINIIYVDNPNNPTGFFFSLDKIERIARNNNNAILIVDEAYADFISDSQSSIMLVKKYSNMVVVRSFSKFYGLASMRVAYAVVSDNLVNHFRKIDTPFEPTILSSILANKALNKELSFQEKTKKCLSANKKILIQHLENQGYFVAPTNFNVPIFLITTNDQINLKKMFDKISIKVICGSSFNITDKRMNNYFARIKVPENKNLCSEFVVRIKKWEVS